jgi:cytochrome P450/ferredoxin-NADP reductase
MTLAAERPTGTPPTTPLTVYYDPLSYGAFDHPYELYRQLRDHAPVYYNERRDLYVVSRYADVRACLRNHEQLVNALGNDMDGTHASYGAGNLVAQDPPRHTALRAAVRKAFGAREILAQEDGLRALVRELLGGMRERGGGDITTELALPLAISAASKLVGAPAADREFFQEHLWRSMARTVGHFGLPADAESSNREAEEHLAAVVERRVAEIEAGADSSSPDAITQIIRNVRVGKVEPGEMIGLAHLVLSAAIDAPAALLSNCVAVLDKYPAVQGYLRENPSLVRNFVEEMLRYDGPAKNLCRQTTSDVTVAGVTIPADSRVMVLMGSANRDDRVFDDPDTFDLFRTFTDENKILSFGEGIHSCMGAPLARLTAQVMVEELVASLDGAELRIVGTPERWTKQMVRGFASLPVRFETADSRPVSLPAPASAAHVESVQHRGTRLTIEGDRQFEAPVRVAAKTSVSEGVIALTLHDLDGHPLPRWEAGAHVDLVLGAAATRQYSLCGSVDDPHQWRLGILRDPNGSGGSLYVHDRLEVGDVVQVRGPRNNFPLVSSPRYVFVAGGIGITPILPMIAAAEVAGAEWELVYGGRTRASMAFLDELAGHGDKVTVWPQDEKGFLDLEGLLGTPRPDTKVYCCGPEGLLNAVEARCASWPKGSLHVERFAAKPLTEPVLQEVFEVHLARSGQTLEVPTDRSVLSVVEDAGIVVLSSCGEGTCGTCETPVLEGVPDHRDSVLDEEAREAGDCMMICVSRSCSPRLVLDL